MLLRIAEGQLDWKASSLGHILLKGFQFSSFMWMLIEGSLERHVRGGEYFSTSIVIDSLVVSSWIVYFSGVWFFSTSLHIFSRPFSLHGRFLFSPPSSDVFFLSNSYKQFFMLLGSRRDRAAAKYMFLYTPQTPSRLPCKYFVIIMMIIVITTTKWIFYFFHETANSHNLKETKSYRSHHFRAS